MDRTGRVTIDFFFACDCPWSYMALGRLREATIRTGTAIAFRPVLLDLVKAAAGAPAAPEQPDSPRARYRTKDLQDWARFCGLVIRPPDPALLQVKWATRGAVVAADAGRAVPYLQAIYGRLFGRNKPVTELRDVLAAAAEAGLDPEGFEERTRSPETLARAERHSQELLAAGGFGTPTMLLGDDLYHGNDRMPLVEVALGRAAGMRLVLPGEHDI